MDTPDSSSTPTTEPETAKAARRKAPARRKAARPRATVSKPAAARRTAPGSKTANRRPGSTKPGPDLWTDLVSGRASAAGAKIARLSRDGATSAKQALADVKGLSKKTARRLARDWQEMSGRRRAQLVATLLVALGAAAVPMVRKALKK